MKSSTRSDSSPRRVRERACRRSPIRSPRSSVEQAVVCAPRRARRRAPGAGSGRSGRRGRGTPSCPGRGARRGGRRRGGARRSPRRPRRPAWAARTSAIGATPGKACGNGSMPSARSALELGAGARRRSSARSGSRRRSRPVRSWRRAYLQPDVDLGDLELARRAAGHLDRDDLVALVAEQRLPTGDSLESLSSAGLASAEPTIVYLTDLPVFSSLTWTIEPTCTTSVDELLGVDHRRRAQLAPRAARSAPRASPARSWRRRTRSSRRCRRTRAPP